MKRINAKMYVADSVKIPRFFNFKIEDPYVQRQPMQGLFGQSI